MNQQPSHADRLVPGRDAPRFERRGLLQLGTLAGLGMELAGVLPARRAKGTERTRAIEKTALESCIVIFCTGGPSHERCTSAQRMHQREAGRLDAVDFRRARGIITGVRYPSADTRQKTWL